MRAVEDLPHELSLSKLLKANAAGVARLEGPLCSQPVDYDLGLVLLPDLLGALSHKLLQERQAPEDELLSLHVNLITCALEGILELSMEDFWRRCHVKHNDSLGPVLDDQWGWQRHAVDLLP